MSCTGSTSSTCRRIFIPGHTRHLNLQLIASKHCRISPLFWTAGWFPGFSAAAGPHPLLPKVPCLPSAKCTRIGRRDGLLAASTVPRGSTSLRLPYRRSRHAIISPSLLFCMRHLAAFSSSRSRSFAPCFDFESNISSASLGSAITAIHHSSDQG